MGASTSRARGTRAAAVVGLASQRVCNGRRRHRGDGLSRAVSQWVESLETRRLFDASPAANYGALPLSFEANVGQTDEQVDFLSRGSGYALFLTDTEAVLSLAGDGDTGAVLRMQLVGASAASDSVASEQLAGKTNYLIGEDPEGWHTNIANYGRVEYRDVYAGIDLVYQGNQQQLQYDFVVAPGASAGSILLNFAGADAVSINAAGELVLQTAAGELRHQAPFIYQDIDGQRVRVSGGFVLNEQNQVGFTVGEYDASKALVIDPTLVYSTFLGGGNLEEAHAIARDASGNAYLTGFNVSSGFPTTVGALDTSQNGNRDVFVAKLNATGTALVYSTYIGGAADDEGHGITVDSAGNAYVAGHTVSTNFPTANAFDGSHGGGRDIFLMRLNATGTALAYSTYLGGSGDDEGRGVALDSTGNAYITGYTDSDSLASGSVADATRNGRDAFAASFSPSGSRQYFTYLGGGSADEGHAIAVDSFGQAHVTGFTDSNDFTTSVGAFDTSHGGGRDAFVTKFNSAATARLYSTYLGGSSLDEGRAIALDGAANAYVTGTTESSGGIATSGSGFDTSHNGGRDIFVSKFDPTGATRLYSTYLGGSSTDEAHAIAVDAAGEAHVAGFTESSSGFPLAAALDSSHNGGRDVAVAKLSSGGGLLLFSSYLGGGGTDEARGIAVDGSGGVYVGGFTHSSGFPTGPGLDTSYNNNGDAFALKINGLAVGNQPPTANAQTVGTNEDIDVTITLTGDDGDPAVTQTLTFKISTLPTNGALYQRAGDGSRGAQITTAGTTVTDSGGRVIFAPDAHENGAPYATFQFTVTDNGTPPLTSSAATVTVNVTAVNDAPALAADNASVTVNEGQTAANTGTYSDIDGGNVAISASVGTVTKTGTTSGTWSWSYTPGDGPDASQTVTITANDGNGGVTTTTFALTVNNVAPAVTAAANQAASEGENKSFNLGSFTDPAGPSDQPYVVSVDWGDGSTDTAFTAANPGSLGSQSHTYADDGDYTVTISVTEDNGAGATGTSTFSVDVTNVKPTIAISGAASVNEGALYSLTLGAVTDPGDDTVTSYVVHWGDGNSDTYTSATGVKTHTYADGPNTYDITVDLVDEDGTHLDRANALQVTVNNVAPSVAADEATVTVDEGVEATNTGTWSDPGADTVTLAASVGTVTKNNDGTWSWSFGTTDGPEDSQTVTIRATDSDGEFTETTFELVVDNVAPTLAISGAASVYEAATYALNLSSGDPGSDTIASWTIDWGDGNVQSVTGNPSSVTHAYADGPNSYTISATATDEDGTHSAGNTVDVTVNNVNPTATANAYTLNEDGSVSGNVITDGTDDSDPAGANDPLTVSAVNGSASGVGTAVSTANGTVTVNADGTFTYSPDANFFGTDSFTYTISDGDGGTSTATVTLTVSEVNDAPNAVNDSASTTQDTPVSGNVLPNDTDPDNTDGITGNEDTLTVTGNTNPAHGTLVINADGSFTYTPDLGYSGADSFTYTISDGTDTDTATVNVNVAHAGSEVVYERDDDCMGGRMVVINGSSAADNIHVAPTAGGAIEVFINGVSKGTFNVTGRIVVFGYGGDDQITIAGAVPNVAWIYGDDGTDLLNLGNGGGIAWGGKGSDHINGGSARDIMIGGDGGDRIVGNAGDDILAAGYTKYDNRFSATSNHEVAWCHIFHEWIRTDLTTQSVAGDSSYTPYEQRVDHLKGTLAGGNNGAFFLNNSTVDDDDDYDQIDMLTGAAGEDWFLWTKGEDKVSGMSATEGAEDLDNIS